MTVSDFNWNISNVKLFQKNLIWGPKVCEGEAAQEPESEVVWQGKQFRLLNFSIIMSLSGPWRCLTSCCRTDWWETRVLTLLFWTHSLAKFCWLPARRAWYQVRSGREYQSDFVNRIYSGTVLWEEFFAISPVVVGISSTSRVDTEWDQCGGVEEGDDTWKILF